MIKFPSIKDFANATYHLKKDGVGEVYYRAKIKLHGTNAAIRREGDKLVAQSRTRVIDSSCDNAGFASFVEFLDPAIFPEGFTFYGEWAGKGIQKNDAITKIADKKFFIFAVACPSTDYEVAEFRTSPHEIEALMGEHDHKQIVILPNYHGIRLSVNDDILEKTANEISDNVEEIGQSDPYVKSVFGIDGPGEGLVYVPVMYQDRNGVVERIVRRNVYSKYAFKAKCESHRVKKTKAAATRKVEVPENVKAFVDVFVTDQRVNQAVTESCEGVYSLSNIPKFLAWIGPDVKKESEVELQKMGLEWKDVSKHVTHVALNKFKALCV